MAPRGAIFPLTIWPLSQLVPLQVRPHDPDIIVSLGYDVTSGPKPQLTWATAQSLALAVQWARKFPNAVILFGNSAHTLGDEGALEEQLKFEMLDRLGFSRTRAVSLGPINNSIEEVRRTRDYVVSDAFIEGQGPREILLITVAIHHAADIWRRDPTVNSVGRLSLQYVSDPGYEKDHILGNQKSAFWWLFATGVRTVLVVLGFPLDLLAKLGVHKVAKNA